MYKLMLVLLLCLFAYVQAADDTPIFTFAVYSDNQSNHATHKIVIAQIAKQHPNFIIHCGDMVQIGAISKSWNTFLKELAPISGTPFYPVIGNHDIFGSGGESILRKYFPDIYKMSGGKAYYSFVYPYKNPEIRVIVLNSNRPVDKESEQGRFLSEQLKTDFPAFRIVAVHVPAYSPGMHGNSKTMQRVFAQYLTGTTIGLVISGHDHIYARQKIENIWFMVDGSGGAPPYKIRTEYIKGKEFFATSKNGFTFIKVYSDHLQVLGIDKDGKVFDTYGIKR
jgi:acid phosphatase type 7